VEVVDMPTLVYDWEAGADSVFGLAFDRERAAYRQVVRMRALYAKRRAYMASLEPYAGERLHYRFKDLERTAIERHHLVDGRLAEVWDHWSRTLPPLVGLRAVRTSVDFTESVYVWS
jgi:hypothetical protein